MHIFCSICSALIAYPIRRGSCKNCGGGGVSRQEEQTESRAFFGSHLSHGKCLTGGNIIPLFVLSPLSLSIGCKYLFPKPPVFFFSATSLVSPFKENVFGNFNSVLETFYMGSTLNIKLQSRMSSLMVVENLY